MVNSVRKVRTEETAKVNGMPTDNDMFDATHRSRKDIVTKFVHAQQSVRIDRFVAAVEGHVHLIGKDVIEVGDLARLVNPRWCDGCVGGCDTESIRVATDFLQRWDDDDFFFRVSGKAVAKATRHGRNSATEAGANDFGGRSRRIAAKDGNGLEGRVLRPWWLLEEGSKFVDLREAQVGQRSVIEPTVHLTTEYQIDFIHNRLDDSWNESNSKDEARSMLPLVERILYELGVYQLSRCEQGGTQTGKQTGGNIRKLDSALAKDTNIFCKH